MELFSNSTGLYLFSALLQANAAIIAIVGVFGIFRIQSLQSKIEYIKQGLLQPRGRDTYDGMSPLEVHNFEELTFEKKEEKFTKDGVSCKLLLNSLINTEKTIINFKPMIAKSTIYLGIGILINALCLMLSNLIHKVWFAESLVFLFIFVYQIILVVILISNIKKLLNFELKDGKSMDNQKKKKKNKLIIKKQELK